MRKFSLVLSIVMLVVFFGFGNSYSNESSIITFCSDKWGDDYEMVCEDVCDQWDKWMVYKWGLISKTSYRGKK